MDDNNKVQIEKTIKPDEVEIKETPEATQEVELKVLTLEEITIEQFTPTRISQAKLLSSHENEEIVQNVVTTYQYLTNKYIQTVKSINQIPRDINPTDTDVICDPLLDEMKMAASTSFLVYQYKLQILLDKAIAKKVKKKKKDEKELKKEEEEKLEA